jgi:tetratricopeptide (TPR) repeat protein/DNA-binding CsgD family transcriptional regulator
MEFFYRLIPLSLNCVCCFILGYSSLTAQTSTADSLRRQQTTLSPDDTLYVLNCLNIWIAEGKTAPESALQCAHEALTASRRIKWLRGEVNALNAIALSKQRQGYFSEALTYYLPALELAERSGNARHISKTHNNLGILYQLTEDYPKALQHYRRVLAVEHRPLDLAGAFTNIGIVSRNLHRRDSALLFYQKALDIYQKVSYQPGLASTYNNIGVVYRDQQQWTDALRYYQQASALYREMNDRESQAIVLGSAGQALTRLGRLDEARDTLHQAMDLARQMGLLVAQGDIAGHLHALYASKGDYASAYTWANSAKIWSDSLQNIQKHDELEAIRAKYEGDKKLALLEKDVALERSYRLLWGASSVGLLLLMAVLAYSFYQTQRRRRIEVDLKEKEIARLIAEEEALRLREEKLHEDLEFRNRELNAQTLHLIQKNELLQNVAEQLNYNKKDAPSPERSQLRSLQRLIESNLNDNEQWEQFKRHFESVHPEYFSRLLQAFPQLTAHDLRYCAYLRLNLSSKEIAALLNISLRGVETQRHRLRKKIQLQGDADLTAWAMRV